MTEAYLVIGFIWAIGWLYTLGVRWMVSEYERWKPEKDREKRFNNFLLTIFIWPFVLGMLHAPAFIDKEWADHNKK